MEFLDKLIDYSKNEKVKLVEDIYGMVFMDFVLDINKYFTSDDIEIEGEKLEICNLLYKLIEDAVNNRGAKLYKPLSNYLFNIKENGESYYNFLRMRAGGEVPEIKDEDPLMNYLKRKCVEYYPSFLIKETNDYDKFGISIFDHNYKDEESSDELIELIKADSELSKLICEDDPIYGFVLQYVLKNGIQVHIQKDAISIYLAMRAYQDCVHRMEFTLEDVLNEIETQVERLRKIARGEEIDTIHFCGIKDIFLRECEEFQISENVILRNTQVKHGYFPIRHKVVFEDSVKLESIPTSVILEYNERTGVIPKGRTAYGNSEADFNLLYKKLNKSLVFGTYYPISITNDIYFTDISSPLNLCVNLKAKDELNYKEAVDISNEELESISAKFNRM